MAISSSFSIVFFFLFSIICFLWRIRSAEAQYEPHAYPIASLISKDLYQSIFLHKDDSACPAKGFYPYEAFVAATKRFPEFATRGCSDTRMRELAAFLAQISHETTGGRATAPDGPYAWGLCFKEKVKPTSNYCDSTVTEWPCHPNKTYKGRGPIEITWNYNYGPAGLALGFDGLGEPELVANHSDLAFKTALWFWMTPRGESPSCHDVMVGRFKPTMADLAANRTVGFGLVTNIINGGFECGIVNDPGADNRIGYYKRYAQIFNVDVGPNLNCENQKSY